MVHYLNDHPHEAAALEWTLILDGAPIYAIRPRGPFAAGTYQLLREFLAEQVKGGIDRVSIPGVLTGRTTLLWGQVVPVVAPEHRGMYSWDTQTLAATVAGPVPPPEASQEQKDAHALKLKGIQDFFERIYHGLRNLGVTSQERALNFVATNAYSIEEVFEDAIRNKMELESMNVVRSPFSRPGSDCWDVEVYFFYPEREVQTVRKVYRCTVDVSDIVPVTIGPTRSWFTR
jgi:cyanobactin maturation PatA/PatG family protease